MCRAITYGAVYGKCEVFDLEKLKPKKKIKKKVDSFYQTLANSSFSEFIFSDFHHNRFLKFIMDIIT
jgi:hypothetical protein